MTEAVIVEAVRTHAAGTRQSDDITVVTVRYGGPLAFSRPDPTQWTLQGRPSEFYTGLGLNKLFTEPYSPNFRNQLLPVTYADWWGDWHRYFGMPEQLRSDPGPLPSEYGRRLALQSIVGIVPSLLIGARYGASGVAWGLSASAAIGTAIGYFAGHGIRVQRIMTDNGACYKATHFATVLRGARHQRITPYTPRHNGKVERYHRILAEEFLYARVWTSEQQRTQALHVWNVHYNYHRPHTTAGNQPPATRLHTGVTNVMASYN